jgi:hypothetical protein
LGKLGLSATVRKQKELKKDMWYILRDIHVDKLLEYVTDNLKNMNENTTGYYAAKDELMDEVNNAIESNELVKMRAALKKLFALDAEYAGESNANAAGEKEYYDFIRRKLEEKLDEVTTRNGKTVRMNNILSSIMGIPMGSKAPAFVSPKAAATAAVMPALKATNMANSTLNSIIGTLSKMNINPSNR